MYRTLNLLLFVKILCFFTFCHPDSDIEDYDSYNYNNDLDNNQNVIFS